MAYYLIQHATTIPETLELLERAKQVSALKCTSDSQKELTRHRRIGTALSEMIVRLKQGLDPRFPSDWSTLGKKAAVVESSEKDELLSTPYVEQRLDTPEQLKPEKATSSGVEIPSVLGPEQREVFIGFKEKIDCLAEPQLIVTDGTWEEIRCFEESMRDTVKTVRLQGQDARPWATLSRDLFMLKVARAAEAFDRDRLSSSLRAFAANPFPTVNPSFLDRVVIATIKHASVTSGIPRGVKQFIDLLKSRLPFDLNLMR